jgi:hypothetical protein
MTSRADRPDLGPVLELVSDDIRRALTATCAALRENGIDHVLIGGLAVGAYGYPRTTKDVDFLVGDKAFREHGGGIITMHPEVPFAVGRIPVDTLAIGPGQEFLADVFGHHPISEGVPIIPLPALVYLKLVAGRARDRSDVIMLLEAGAHAGELRNYIADHSPHLVNKLETWIAEADLPRGR